VFDGVTTLRPMPLDEALAIVKKRAWIARPETINNLTLFVLDLKKL
jgi:hypothetical protein